MQGRI